MSSYFYKKNQYILDCDFLNKHLTKSLYKMPSIKSIKISFSLSDISDKKIYPAKAYLIFYLLYSLMPFIKMNKENKKLFTDTVSFEKNCDFKIVLSNKDLILLFFFDHIELKTLFEKKVNTLTNISFFSKEIKNFNLFPSAKKDPRLKIYSFINFYINLNIKNFSQIKNINSCFKNITFLN